jgi:hypothetical protein
MNHTIKITAIELDNSVNSDGSMHPSDLFRVSFKCADRQSGSKELFTRDQMQPLLNFMGYEHLSDLKNYTFGISPTTREFDGFIALLNRARAAMTPVESLLGLASETIAKIGAADLSDPRTFQRAVGQLLRDDGPLAPIAQILKETLQKPQHPTNGTVAK